jgi:hypothetical protein
MGMNSNLFWANRDEILSSDDPKEVHMNLNIFIYMNACDHVYTTTSTHTYIHAYIHSNMYIIG